MWNIRQIIELEDELTECINPYSDKVSELKYKIKKEYIKLTNEVIDHYGLKLNVK
jgi:hypothetical protein